LVCRATLAAVALRGSSIHRFPGQINADVHQNRTTGIAS
jgi:hypothetical protein